MNPESVEFSHIHVKGGVFLVFCEFITFDELGGILSVALTLRRIPVHVVNEFL